jgi:hypothetical protein
LEEQSMRFAIKNGHKSVLEEMLNKGGDIEAKDEV